MKYVNAPAIPIQKVVIVMNVSTEFLYIQHVSSSVP